MTQVVEARAEYDQARDDAKASIDRARARLGRSIAEARESGGPGAQSAVMEAMGKSREQVRAFEKAYRDWLRDHDGQQP